MYCMFLHVAQANILLHMINVGEWIGAMCVKYLIGGMNRPGLASYLLHIFISFHTHQVILRTAICDMDETSQWRELSIVITKLTPSHAHLQHSGWASCGFETGGVTPGSRNPWPPVKKPNKRTTLPKIIHFFQTESLSENKPSWVIFWRPESFVASCLHH